MDPARVKPIAALVLVQFCFATLSVVGKVALEALPAFFVAGVRIFFASLVLAAIALATRREPIPPRVHAQFFGLSLLGVTLNQLLFLEGLDRTSPINAIILIATIPVFTTLLAVLWRKERARPVRVAGILVATAGALVLVDVREFRLEGAALGNLLVVANCLCYSFYLVLSRPLLHRHGSTVIAAWTFLYGGLVTLPLATFAATTIQWSAIPSSVWLHMAWIILVPSVAAYGLNNYALKRIEASTVATYVFLQPLIGVLLTLLVLPEYTLESTAVFGGLLILAGVILVSRVERYAPVPAIGEGGELAPSTRSANESAKPYK